MLLVAVSQSWPARRFWRLAYAIRPSFQGEPLRDDGGGLNVEVDVVFIFVLQRRSHTVHVRYGPRGGPPAICIPYKLEARHICRLARWLPG